MELFGLDIVGILLTAGYMVFWGGLIIGFVFFYSKNPYVPRKYYKVELESKDGRYLRDCKGWVMKEKKVEYFRVQLKGFPSLKAVNLDASVLEAVNSKGIMQLVESVPDYYDASNYRPREVPLTQRGRFVEELVEDVIKPLCIREYKEGEEIKQGYDKAAVEFYRLKAKEALDKNSRIEDLNRSAAVRARIDVVRNQDERKKGGEDIITKLLPVIIIIAAGLFAYLILDGSVKAYSATMAQQNAVMENGYSQIVSQCGGVYRPMNQPQNVTPQKTGVQIPFITT